MERWGHAIIYYRHQRLPLQAPSFIPPHLPHHRRKTKHFHPSFYRLNFLLPTRKRGFYMAITRLTESLPSLPSAPPSPSTSLCSFPLLPFSPPSFPPVLPDSCRAGRDIVEAQNDVDDEE
ncbi:hypothetical protein E2C01_009845 [Portunus trituberculatus]|uniref:Uncharacterized protein n=1 Tax=Portunus trituberculatus TaxID=210409 RepID=A0A5B7D6T0_PORTR|nr:hypothetical protein [Portunus trituberculatus]